ncbi:MAG: hypothetical protein QOE23_1914 [Pseudonocardiales bacterium]|jgi:hypothetical protein|nr:hypothetical protein [Pseudonocardiales bacterium]
MEDILRLQTEEAEYDPFACGRITLSSSGSVCQ